MKKEITNLVKKTAKIAGVTCIAAGAVAIMTSKTAVQSIVKGGVYLKDAVKKILRDEPQADEAAEEALCPEVHEEAPAAAEEEFVPEAAAAAEESSAAEEAPAVEEAPAEDEAPAVEEAPADDEVPAEKENV